MEATIINLLKKRTFHTCNILLFHCNKFNECRNQGYSIGEKSVSENKINVLTKDKILVSHSTLWKINHRQQPPTFWHQGWVYWKILFPGKVWGRTALRWFKHMIFIGHFNLMFLLILGEVLVCGPKVGDPCH